MDTKQPARIKMRRCIWRTISQEVCTANELPPGFRIAFVLDGRLLRDDIFVTTEGPQNSAWSDSFRVWAFLERLMEEDILPHNPHFLYDDIVLKDHRNRTVDPNTHLWVVRDMVGLKDRLFYKRRVEREDRITEIASEIETMLDEKSEECSSMGEDAERLMPLALLELAFEKFDTDFLEYALSRYAEPGSMLRVSQRFRKKR